MNKEIKLPFKKYDENEIIKKLPEGYKPLEYLKVEPERTVFVQGFANIGVAQKRLEELNTIYPSDNYAIHPLQIEMTPKEFAIEVPESVIKELRPEEKEKIYTQNPYIRIDDYRPFLYRHFTNKEHAESFAKGKNIKITNFKKCSEIKDDNRRDGNEGRNVLVVSDGPYRAELDVAVGKNAFLLCTSLSQINYMVNGEPYPATVRITDYQGLTIAVGNALAKLGFVITQVYRGPCTYSNKILNRNSQGMISKESIENPFSVMEKMVQIAGSEDMLFNKPAYKRHQLENEFRFLWFTNQDVNEDVYIDVPEMPNYCELL